MQPEQEVIQRWTGSAPYWEKHREIIRQMFAPVTQALIEEAQIDSGHVVLDIAMGPGEPALSVAGLVGPKGKVFGVDPIPEMVAAARRAADRLGLQNTQFDVAFADRLPFPAVQERGWRRTLACRAPGLRLTGFRGPQSSGEACAA